MFLEDDESNLDENDLDYHTKLKFDKDGKPIVTEYSSLPELELQILFLGAGTSSQVAWSVTKSVVLNDFLLDEFEYGKPRAESSETTCKLLLSQPVPDIQKNSRLNLRISSFWV